MIYIRSRPRPKEDREDRYMTKKQERRDVDPLGCRITALEVWWGGLKGRGKERDVSRKGNVP